MSASQIIEYKGDPEFLVWKAPQEIINPASQLLVDSAHEAILIIDGNPVAFFEDAGKYTLNGNQVPPLSMVPGFYEGGDRSAACQIYYISKTPQMNLLWGTSSPILLYDPEYQMQIHVMAHGRMSYIIEDAGRFLRNTAQLHAQFTPEDLKVSFRAIINTHVRDYITKIMSEGQVSFLKVTAHTIEIGEILQEKMKDIFAEYGIEIVNFIVEEIAVPDIDLKEVQSAERRRAGRRIEGYSWRDEQGMEIAKTLAGKESGMGKATDEAFASFLRQVLADNDETPSAENPIKSTGDSRGSGNSGGAKFCPNCGKPINPGQKFCMDCGFNLQKNLCPNCGKPVKAGQRFCGDCGFSLNP